MIINLSVTGKMPLTPQDMAHAPDVSIATTSGISAVIMSEFVPLTVEVHLLVPDSTPTATIDEVKSTLAAGYVREGWTDVTVTII